MISIKNYLKLRKALFVADMPQDTLVCLECYYQGTKLSDHLKRAPGHQDAKGLLSDAKDVRKRIIDYQAVTERNLKVRYNTVKARV